jgi:hypothetical protein
MKKYLYRITAAIILVMILIVSFAIPVFAADIDLPDVQTIDKIEVYNDALGEEDSQLWLVNYNCDYTSNTTTYDISEAFIFVLKETTTNVTVGMATAYPYFDSGYDNGIISFEFEASEALTWGGNYTLYFYGNPTLDWFGGTPPVVNSNAITWLDEGSVNEVQDRLTTRLRYIAGVLEAEWVIDLIETSSTGTVFTTYGEDYFTNSISDLRDICPDLFYQSMTAVEYEHDILITDMLSSGADTSQSINTTSWASQTFQPSESYSITGINIPAYRVGLPGTLTVSLRTTAAGLPDGADLVSGTYDADTLGTAITGSWINIAFSSDYPLTVGTTYALVARTSVGGATMNWLLDTDNGYADGQECTSADSGATWVAVPANDLLFEIEGRGAKTMGIAARVEERLVGTQFDFTDWADEWGLSRIWWSTIFWVAISAVVMVAASFGANSWDCSMVVLAIMISYGWRGGWVDTIVFAMIFALLSGGVIYAVFWKRT